MDPKLKLISLFAAFVSVVLALCLFASWQKADRMNAVYGTNFTTWDVFCGVEEHFRSMEVRQ